MMLDTDEVQAVRCLKSGDIGGLELLIARYQGKALRTAFLVTQDESLAEDVVQDAFVHFFLGLSIFFTSFAHSFM